MTANIPSYVRKIVVQVDEIHREMGRDIAPPTRRALAMAVIANPCAGRYAENLDALIAIGEELGGLLGDRCVQALGITPAQAQSYGKAAIVAMFRALAPSTSAFTRCCNPRSVARPCMSMPSILM